MWQVQNNEIVHDLGHVESDIPRNRTAPVVTNNRGTFLTQVTNNRYHIRHQQPHVVGLDAFRFVAQVVTALINCNNAIAILETLHLMTPAVPEVREPMDHHN